MALPVLAKSWSFQVNNVQPSKGSFIACTQYLIYAIKNMFLAAGWTVRSSCGGASKAALSVNNAGGDKWTAPDQIWWNYGSNVPRSWIVLRNTALGSAFDIVIDCVGQGYDNYVDNQVIIIGFAIGGYNLNGTTSARPTATNSDECLTCANANPYFGGPWLPSWVDVQYAYHGIFSTDKECNRIIIYQNNSPVTIWLFEKLATPVTGFTDPITVMTIASNGPFANIVTAANLSANNNWKFRYGSANYSANMTVEGLNAVSLPNQIASVNDIDGSWPIMPCGFYCSTYPARGRHAIFYDLWQGSTSLSSGSTYPSDNSRQFAQHGCLITPWNGSQIVTA